MKVLRLVATVTTLALLASCGAPEDRAAVHIEKARSLMEAGDFVKAKLEAQNATQILPKNAEARLILADIAEENGNFRAAIGHLLVAADANPDLLEVHTRLGLYYFLGKAEDRAQERAAAAMAIAPENSEARLLNARVLYLQGNMDGAVDEALYAIDLDDENTDAIMFLSGLRAEGGDFDAGFAILDAALERVPADKQQILRQFRLQLLGRSGRFDELEAELADLIRDYPDEVDYRYALAQFYAEREQPDKALEIVRELVALDPENPDPKIALVRLLVTQGKQAQSEQALKTFIDEYPQQHELQFALAALYESMQRPESAGAVYEKLAEADPKGETGLAARNQLALLALRSNQLDKARSIVEGILEDSPGDHDALLLRAAFLFADNDFDATIADLRIALRQEENSERALLLLARAYIRTGDGVLAQDAYRRLLSVNPKHPQASRELAALLANQGDTAAAQRVLEARLSVEPGDTLAASGLIQTMLVQEDLAGAEVEARKLVELNEDNALAQLQLGRVMQAKGSADEAIAAYRSTLEKNPQSTAALKGLIQVLTKNDRFEEAIEYLQAHSRQYPETADGSLLLAAVYVEQDERDLAIRQLEELIESTPRELRAYIALAALYPEKSIEREAVYKRGWQANPGSPEVGLLLTSFYERQQRYEDAIELYEQILESNPGNIFAINNLAALLLDFREDDASFARALELARKLESVEQPAFLDTLGWAYYRTGNIPQAVRYLERAVAGAGQVPVLRYHLGMAYAAGDNPVGARQELSQALQNDNVEFAGVEEARSKLAELKSL